MTADSEKDIRHLKAIGRICALALKKMMKHAKPGMTTAELAAAMNKAAKSDEFDAEEIERIALEYDRTYSGEVDVWQLMAWCIAKYRNRETNGRATLPEPISDQSQQHTAGPGYIRAADDGLSDGGGGEDRGREGDQPGSLSGVDSAPSVPEEQPEPAIKRKRGRPREDTGK
jgi:hypothetical protein